MTLIASKPSFRGAQTIYLLCLLVKGNRRSKVRLRDAGFISFLRVKMLNRFGLAKSDVKKDPPVKAAFHRGI